MKLPTLAPEKPLSPLALAFPPGGKSNPMPVILASKGEVFVIVKVKVFVCELNEQLTVAVASNPFALPTIWMVSALAVAAPKRIRAQTLKAKFRKVFDWHIKNAPCWM